MSGLNNMLYKYYKNYSGIYACNVLNVCDALVANTRLHSSAAILNFLIR